MPIHLLLPEISLSIFIFILLLQSLYTKDNIGFKFSPFTYLMAVLPGALTLFQWGTHETILWGTYEIDTLSQFFKIIISISLTITLYLSENTKSICSSRRIEFAFFLACASLGMMVIASAIELITFYVALELIAYSTYVMVPLKDKYANAEGGLKYIIFGAVASGFLLYGMSILLGLTQTTLLLNMMPLVPQLAQEPSFLIAVFFILIALFFKLSLFPFHFWAPDVYEVSPSPVTTFIATSSKAIAAVILIRIVSMLGISTHLIPILGFFAFFSMTIGNTVALTQNDLKRLLAYSSIAQAGYILVALMSVVLNPGQALSAVFFYACIYLVMNLGVFMVIIHIGKVHNTDNPKMDDLNGLAEKYPILGLILLISVLSLAGIPPLAGFTGKWFLFTAAMLDGHWFLVLWGVVNSVISLYYYLTMVKHAYLKPPSSENDVKLSWDMQVLALAIFAILIILGVYPTPLLELAQHSFI